MEAKLGLSERWARELDRAKREVRNPVLPGDTCEDCNGTGMVPSIGPEADEDDGYVPCQSCKREGGAA